MIENGLPAIQYQKCHFGKNGLVIEPGLEFEEWQNIGQFLRAVKSTVLFWLGDWLSYGEKHYGDTYKRALTTTGLTYGTLRNIKYVANKLPLSLRNYNLSFSHHKIVASLDPEKQKYFLALAESQKLSSRQLASSLRPLPSSNSNTTSNNNTALNITCPHCNYSFNPNTSNLPLQVLQLNA